jgi:hypothetical protein
MSVLRFISQLIENLLQNYLQRSFPVCRLEIRFSSQCVRFIYMSFIVDKSQRPSIRSAYILSIFMLFKSQKKIG